MSKFFNFINIVCFSGNYINYSRWKNFFRILAHSIHIWAKIRSKYITWSKMESEWIGVTEFHKTFLCIFYLIESNHVKNHSFDCSRNEPIESLFYAVSQMKNTILLIIIPEIKFEHLSFVRTNLKALKNSLHQFLQLLHKLHVSVVFRLRLRWFHCHRLGNLFLHLENARTWSFFIVSFHTQWSWQESCYVRREISYLGLRLDGCGTLSILVFPVDELWRSRQNIRRFLLLSGLILHLCVSWITHVAHVLHLHLRRGHSVHVHRPWAEEPWHSRRWTWRIFIYLFHIDLQQASSIYIVSKKEISLLIYYTVNNYLLSKIFLIAHLIGSKCIVI